MATQIEHAPRMERREERKIETVERENELARMGVATAASAEHPERNEDAFALTEKETFAIVADGEGPAASGELAGHFVAYTLPREFETAVKAMKEPSTLQKEWRDFIREERHLQNLELPREMQETILAMNRALQETNKDVRRLAKTDRELKNMTSSAVAAKLMREKDGRTFAIFGSIGDGTIRIRRKDGTMEMPLQSDLRSQRLGRTKVTPMVTIAEMHPGDRILLASKGLENNDRGAAYEQSLGEDAPAATLAERMLRRAEEAIENGTGEGWDDITALVIDIKKPEEEIIELEEKDIEFIKEEPVDEKRIQQVLAETDVGAFYRSLEALNVTELRRLREEVAREEPKEDTKKTYRLKLVEEKIEEKELLS